MADTLAKMRGAVISIAAKLHEIVSKDKSGTQIRQYYKSEIGIFRPLVVNDTRQYACTFANKDEAVMISLP